MNNKPFDKTKPVQTRDGRAARIVAELNTPAFPLLAVITNKNGSEGAQHFTREGYLYGPGSLNPADLVNVPVKITRTYFINVYSNESGSMDCLHETRHSADSEASNGRLACVPVTVEFEEGQGL